MAVAELHLNYQPSVGRMVSVSVIIPEGTDGPWATLYLLHGLSDDHTTWLRRTSLERYAQNFPLLIVMPSTERGWYVDSVTRPQDGFGTFMTRDLTAFIDRTFHTRATRDGRSVAGLSMGGYGAMRLALGNPDLYCAAVSHSGAVEATHPAPKRPLEWQMEIDGIFGPSPLGGVNDVFTLALQCPAEKRPALRVDCGASDFLIEDNRRFHTHLTQLGYAHEYAEHEGGHDWAYWDRHITETLSFVSREMGILGP